jgi:hypothetical protein
MCRGPEREPAGRPRSDRNRYARWLHRGVPVSNRPSREGLAEKSSPLGGHRLTAPSRVCRSREVGSPPCLFSAGLAPRSWHEGAQSNKGRFLLRLLVPMCYN